MKTKNHTSDSLIRTQIIVVICFQSKSSINIEGNSLGWWENLDIYTKLIYSIYKTYQTNYQTKSHLKVQKTVPPSTTTFFLSTNWPSRLNSSEPSYWCKQKCLPWAHHKAKLWFRNLQIYLQFISLLFIFKKLDQNSKHCRNITQRFGQCLETWDR